jgi:hypothetical protein
MNRFLFVFLVLLFACVSAVSEQPPNIGSKFKKSWRSKESGLCMTSSAQLDPCVERVFDGIKYSIAYGTDTHRVTYVYTDDEKFRTIDGLKVGDSIAVSRDTVVGEPGWQSYAPATGNGWLPVVGFDGLQIKLMDGSVIDLTSSEGIKKGTALIRGFSKTRR